MKKIFQEFKEFAFRGNVIDMAVGVVIGSAFTGIVNSIVEDIFTPLIAVITGSVDFTALAVMMGDGADAPRLAVGNFIQAVINFLMIAICVFIFVKFINKLRSIAPAKEEEAAPEPHICPYCKSEIPEGATRCPHCTSVLTEEKAA